MRSTRIAVALAALVLGVGAAGCGGDDDSDGTATDETTTDETTTETETDETEATAGRTIFVDNCGTCHALSDAGTNGAIGPSLDGTGLALADVESQVRSGGGGMPAFEGQLSDEEIEIVSAYVVDVGSG
jgi:mono/diheme cytochrome c family protein